MIKAIVFDCFGVLGSHSAAGWTRQEALLRYIQELKSQYKIGLLSNLGAASLNALFSAEERQKLFDAEVISGEVGIAKPNPQIYTLVCEKLGVAPNEAVFVDDITDNIKGAEAIGMQTLWYRDFATFQRGLAELLQNTETEQ